MTSQQKVAAMTVSQCQARLAEIKRLSRQGNYNWDFGEYVLITERLPEEREATKVAFEKQKWAARRRTLGY